MKNLEDFGVIYYFDAFDSNDEECQGPWSYSVNLNGTTLALCCKY